MTHLLWFGAGIVTGIVACYIAAALWIWNMMRHF